MVNKLLSICNKIYSKLTGKDVQKIQSDIIDSLERELSSTRHALQIKDNRYNTEVHILQCRINELSGVRVGLQKELHEEKNKPDVVVVEKQFVMTEAVYQKFARSLEPPVVTNNTTAQGAGYICGIQRVLEKMREQFVSGS